MEVNATPSPINKSKNGGAKKANAPIASWRDRQFPISIRAAAPVAGPGTPEATRFTVGLPAEERLTEPFGAGGEPVMGVPAEPRIDHLRDDAGSTPALPEAPCPTAVLVFHGMGQQVRFQTLSDLASGILDEAEASHGKVKNVHIQLVPKVGKPGQFLARAELAWTDKDGVDHAAHVYEAYWAPLTEGKVKYWDTIKFLIEGGWNGLSSIIGGGFKFQRWLFGNFYPMRITKGTPFALVGILVLLGLTVAIIAMAGSAVIGIAHHLSSPSPSVAFAAVRNTIYVQIASPWTASIAWVSTRMSCFNWMAKWELPSPEGAVGAGAYTIAVAAWLALIYAAWFVRSFIIEYVGSVAAYLSPYKDSKFEKLRGAIQKVGLDAARLIFYGYRNPEAAPWIPEYRNIVFVGHSLGSVLAYDTLNAIFNIETTSRPPGTPNEAVARTRALITFGSPLDKAAFIFRAQFNRGTLDGKLREIAACAIQPLIADYAFRFDTKSNPHGPLWINLWSPMDIISGSLDYYDRPDVVPADPSHVHNTIDWGAWIPLMAHVQYWTTKKFRKTVYELI